MEKEDKENVFCFNFIFSAMPASLHSPQKQPGLIRNIFYQQV